MTLRHHRETLPSTRVTRDFLIELQQYVLRQASQIEGLQLEDTRKNFIVVLVTENATEEMDGVEELGRSFPDDVRACTLLYDSESEIQLRISLTFSTDRASNNYTIMVNSENARETIAGLSEGLENVLAQEATGHHLISNDFGKGLFGIGGFALVIYALNQWSASNRWGAAAAVVATTLLWLFYKSKPYAQFKTRRSDALDRFSTTIFIALLGSVTFAILSYLLPGLR